MLARTLAWLRRALALPAPAGRRATDSVVGADEFRRIVLRERARSDRIGGSLSLLLLDAGGEHSLEDQFEAWSLTIAQRVRCTDAVGWYDGRTVGVVLPDTDHEGALIVSRQLKSALPATAAQARWRLFVHPEHTRGADAGRPNSGGRDAQDPLELLRAPDSGSDAVSGHVPRTRVAAAAASPATAGASIRARSNGRGGATAVATRSERAVDASSRRSVVSLAAAGLSETSKLEVQPLQSLLLVRTSPLKRCVDIAGASLALLALSPVLLAAAVAVKLTSPGPVLFRQQRAGLGGRPFTFYKFRSMTADAEARKKDLLAHNEQTGPVFKIAADPRITRVGRILRRTSIDELPQLWNVLRGDMSLVGPRPPILAEVKDYERWQRRRLEIAGGLTCIWQVSGRSSILFNDWVRLDLRYVEQSSAWTDLRLLARTIPAVVTCRGAH